MKNLAVWWTNSEASNAYYERQTIASMTTSINEMFAQVGKPMGGVREERKTSKVRLSAAKEKGEYIKLMHPS